MPAYSSDLAAVYAAEAELVTIDGVPTEAFFGGGYAEIFDAAGTAPSLRCISSAVAGVAVGATVVRGAASYTVRNLIPIAPDELETRLVLEAS